MSNKLNDRSVHLVLGGGGVLSLSYAGALSVLQENGIGFASVSCCSAGTFIGALLCARHTADGLVEDILDMSVARLEGRPAMLMPDMFYSIIPGALAAYPMFHWPFAKYRKSGFPEVFQELLGRDPTFKNLKPRFATAAFDIVQKRFLVYDSATHPDMKVSKAMAIAVSYPFAYPPHDEGGRIVLDAGVASECPVWMAADLYDLPIVALRPRRKIRPGERPRTIEAYLYETLGSTPRGLDDYIISQMPRVKLIEIDCGEISSNRFDLNYDEKKALINKGRRWAERAMERFGSDFREGPDSQTPPPLGGRDDEKALARGTHLMTRFHQDLSKDVSNRVFLSYSHKDKEWLGDIKAALSDKLPIYATWDDSRIDIGESWKKEVATALKGCSVALLLLSPNFFESKAISDYELPAILKAFREEDLQPIPVVLRSDDERWDASAINEAGILAANLEQPLEEVWEDEQQRQCILYKIAARIHKKIPTLEPPPTSGTMNYAKDGRCPVGDTERH